MRPLLLKMTSFGPYLDETIDFSLIKNSGIFLIAGDTGSGKTTIFDAISVALFGESNGDERSAESFKSDFDHAEQMMRVELTFELRGKIYKVNRIPRQKRKKKLGDGFTEDLGEVTLYEVNNDNETAIAFSKDVNPKIRELLGIDSKQFRQIVMIPQGQFRKLITESSEEREKILKSIFDVSICEKFQKNIALYNKELENALKEEKNTLNTEAAHIKCNENTALFTYIHANDLNTTLIIEETKKLINDDKKQLSEIDTSISENKLSIITLDKQIEEAKQINSKIDAYKEAFNEKQKLDDLKEYFEDVSQKVERAERIFRIEPIFNGALAREKEVLNQKELIRLKEEELKGLQEKLDITSKAFNQINSSENMLDLNVKKENLVSLRSLLPKVLGLNELNNTLSNLNKEYKKEEKQLEDLKLTLEYSKNTFDELAREKEALANVPLHIEKNQNKLNDLTKKIELIKQLEQLRNQYIEAIEEHKKALELYNKISVQRKSQQEHYDEQSNHWIKGQAGILAKELKEGEPCPVCGSLHHIKPAELDDEIPTQAELDKIKEELEKTEKTFNKRQMDLAKGEQNRHNKKEQLIEALEKVNNIFGEKLLLERHAISEYCIRQGEAIKTEITANEIMLSKLVKEQQQFEEKNKALENMTVRIKEEETLIQNLQNTHLKTLENKTIKESEIKSVIGEIPEELRNHNILSDRISQLEQDIRAFEKKIEDGKKDIEDVRRAHDHASGILIEARSALEEKTQAYALAIKDFENSIIENGFSDKAEIERYRLSEESLGKLKTELTDYRQRVHTNMSNLLKLSQEVKDLEKIDIIVLQNKRAELEKIIEELANSRTLLSIRINDNSNQIYRVEKIYEKIEDMIKEHSIVNDLSQVANGTFVGTQKITFERYILAAFLQEIIDAANIRFHKMSNGRYELIRKDKSSDKRKHTGLDIEVFDYYTGKARDINTLSGGEGFKASLSLALGLADVAQAYAGGINLDTMFVDEGFGSLSSESLDYAINCLMDLKEGGRLVGIISHVQELKDRIATKLIVEKQKTGSKTYLYI